MSVSEMRSPYVVGYFGDLGVARKAIKQLREFGFDPSGVGCALATVEDPDHPGIWTRVLNFFVGERPRAAFANSLDFLRLPYANRRALEEKLARGGALVVVFDVDRAEVARRILESCGAEPPRETVASVGRSRRLWIKLIGKCAECLEEAA